MGHTRKARYDLASTAMTTPPVSAVNNVGIPRARS